MRKLTPLLVLLVLLLAIILGVGALLSRWGGAPRVVPSAEQCVVRVGEVSDSLGLEESQNAAIIVAEAQRRGLPARASSIALATAMQESKLRNIDHGDRDSVGLFQQRPSQGWGTVEQIMDPWYSAGKFYDHLVKVDGWESGDINDVAQQVQRSGVPEGYRKHVEKAKAWGSALTGHSPAAISCVDRGEATPNTALARTIVERGFGDAVALEQGQARLTLTGGNQTQLWSATHLVLMTTGSTGVTGVSLDGRELQVSGNRVASWQEASQAPAGATEAVLTLRA
ncbi:hypothetical protein [Luteococcus sp. OSA5]|uniref:hypothetical protein n=1 Tax=Luteococcus sp. OSA5 TaxID=3401630 RepID=UPI003B428AB1